MIKCFVLFLIFIIIPNPLTADIQQSYKFKKVRFVDDVPKSGIISIIQGRQGFMWFATFSGGLVKYDGYKTHTYQFIPGDPNSLNTNHINTMYQDRRGNLWIALRGGGLDRFDPETDTFTHFTNQPDSPNSLPNNYINTVYETTDGTIWTGHYNGGLCSLIPPKIGDPSSDIKIRRYQSDPKNYNSLSSNVIHTLCADRFGMLWIGTEGGLDRYDPQTGQFTKILSRTVTAMLVDSSGDIWIGTMRGELKKILINADSKPEMAIINISLKHNTQLDTNKEAITCLSEDKQDHIWIGTNGGGLIKLNRMNNRTTHFKHLPGDRGSLDSNNIYSVCTDRTGNLWFGLGTGEINKLNHNAGNFMNYRLRPDQNQLGANSVSALFEDSFGNLWAGSRDGSLWKFKLNMEPGESQENSREPVIQKQYKITNRPVMAIHMDQQEHLWIGTQGNGLMRSTVGEITDGRWTSYRHDPRAPESIGSNIIFDIHEDSKHNLWLATGKGISLLTPGNRSVGKFLVFRHENHNPHSLSHNYVLSIYEDNNGMIWAATFSGGLNRFNPHTGKFNRFLHNDDPDSISSNCVMSIYEDSSKQLWIGTGDGGLNLFIPETDTFKRVTQKEGLPDNTIYSIMEDNQKHIWVSTKKGLCRISPATWSFLNFDHNDGIQHDQFNFNAHSKNPHSGRFFFGGIEGVTTFIPNLIRKNSHEPPIHITEFTIFNRRPSPGKIIDSSNIKLNYHDNMFSFEFVALDFSNPRKNQYAFFLEGFNREWVQTDWNQRRATFTNIPPGHYTFWVKGSNNHGVWNKEGAAFHIYIEPPFWQTWWFRVILIFFSGALILALHKKRMNDLRIRLKTDDEIHKIYTRCGITTREIEIIDLLKKKKSYREIEDILFISYHTVKNHIYNIYKKLGVTTQGELIYFLKSIKEDIKRTNPAGPQKPMNNSNQ